MRGERLKGTSVYVEAQRLRYAYSGLEMRVSRVVSLVFADEYQN